MPPELLPAAPQDIADALAFALRYSGRKRVHDSAEIMSAIVAKRLVEHLDRCGFVVMRKPPIPGSAAPYSAAAPDGARQAPTRPGPGDKGAG
jgi:hypothetical protein